MMDDYYSNLQKQVDGFARWYQTIDFGNGVVSKGYGDSGTPAWPWIKDFLPNSLEGMKVLDLGCNAGYYCVMPALMGAEVVGVDEDVSGEQHMFHEQARLVKFHFESVHNRRLNITYLPMRVEEFLFDNHHLHFGHFDVVIAFGILYHIYQNKYLSVVEQLRHLTDTIIAKFRHQEGTGSKAHFGALFSVAGFDITSHPKNQMVVCYRRR